MRWTFRYKLNPKITAPIRAIWECIRPPSVPITAPSTHDVIDNMTYMAQIQQQKIDELHAQLEESRQNLVYKETPTLWAGTSCYNFMPPTHIVYAGATSMWFPDNE